MSCERQLEYSKWKFKQNDLEINENDDETDEQAREEQWPNYLKMVGRIGRERGWAPPTEENFIQECMYGSQYVGSPETVAKKIAHAIKSVGAQRFDFKYANGPQSHSSLMKSLELYGNKVIPMVKDLLS